MKQKLQNNVSLFEVIKEKSEKMAKMNEEKKKKEKNDEDLNKKDQNAELKKRLNLFGKKLHFENNNHKNTSEQKAREKLTINTNVKPTEAKDASKSKQTNDAPKPKINLAKINTNFGKNKTENIKFNFLQNFSDLNNPTLYKLLKKSINDEDEFFQALLTETQKEKNTDNNDLPKEYRRERANSIENLSNGIFTIPMPKLFATPSKQIYDRRFSFNIFDQNAPISPNLGSAYGFNYLSSPAKFNNFK